MEKKLLRLFREYDKEHSLMKSFTSEGEKTSKSIKSLMEKTKKAASDLGVDPKKIEGFGDLADRISSIARDVKDLRTFKELKG